jgi:hypothetical protein
MRKLLLYFGLLLLGLGPAQAADNALIVTPGVGVTMRTIDDGGAHQIGTSVPVGVNGVSAWGTAGTANTNVLTVQGIAAMTPLLVTATQSGTWNIGTVTTLTTVTNPVAVTESGTWTVQPGNTANTTPWLVAGNVSNATSAIATGATNMANVAYNYGFNGATWDQLQVDASKFLKVNCSAGCSSSTSITNWGGGVLGAMANYGTAPGAVLVPGINAFVTNANANGRAVSASSSPVVPSSAPTTFHLIAANTTNATSVKGSAATLIGCQMSNNSTTPAYLKIYNKASSPTVGTDVPVVTAIIPGPAAGGGGSNIQFGPGGLALGTGFALAVTGVITDADTTAVAASAFAIN